LVTNSTGRVVQIIYNSADADAVTKGECIIVHFPSFSGSVSQSLPNEVYFPFANHNLVTAYHSNEPAANYITAGSCGTTVSCSVGISMSAERFITWMTKMTISFAPCQQFRQVNLVTRLTCCV
jgi:hypothetical protein